MGASDVLPGLSAQRQDGAPWHWIAALLAALTVGSLAYPRLDQSLWQDEEFSIRFYVSGEFARDLDKPGHENGEPFFLARSWRDSIFDYNTPNNHTLYTIAAKASLSVWRLLGGHERWEFSEAALRLPAYLCVLGSIFAWVALGRRLGLNRAACAGIALLAVNPWFIRYAAEARGYGMVFLFLPLGIMAAKRAAEEGRWRWWLTYGFLQFLTLYAWPGVGVHAVIWNLAFFALLAVRARRPGAPAFRHQWKRWALGNLAAIMLLFQLMAPCIPQTAKYLQEEQRKVPVGKVWAQSLAGEFLAASEWSDYYGSGYASNPAYFSVERLAHWGEARRSQAAIKAAQSGKKTGDLPWSVADLRSPPLVYGTVAALGILVVAGFVRMLCRGGISAVLAVSMLAAPLICHQVAYRSGNYLFHWYFIYTLPFLALCAGAGLDLASRLIFRSRAGKALPAMALCLTATYAFVVWPKIRGMHLYPIDPLRDSVIAAGRSPDITAPENMKSLSGHVHFGALAYDPLCFPVDEAFSNSEVIPGLTKMMRWADQLDVPLLINIGFASDARAQKPEIMKIIDDPDLFSLEATVWAHEPQYVRYIYRYRGGLFRALRPPAAAPSDAEE
ncbi:MAG: glycosyltransferase family 39 protein [Verrucomicrobiales bacterium]